MEKIRVVLDKVIGLVKTKIYGSSGNVADVNSSGEVLVNLTGADFSGTFSADVNVHDGDGDSIDSTGGAVHAKVTSSALPSGAATAANQSNIYGELQTLNSLVPDTYDYVSLSYTGDNLTSVVFKTGGSGGTTVSTLTLAYSGSNLTSVTKS